MFIELKFGKSYSKTQIGLASLGAIALILAFLLSSVFSYVAAACFALFIAFDKSNKKWISIVVLSSVAVINVVYIILAALLPNYFYYSLCGIQVIVLGLIIAFAFLSKRSKAETVFALCVAVAVFLVADLYFLIVGVTDTFSFAKNTEFLISYVSDMRTLFVDSMMKMASQLPEASQSIVTHESVEMAFDGVIRLTTAILFIFAFFGAGVASKIFSYLAFTFSNEEEQIVKWHFTTTSIIAYFFCVVFIVNGFVSGNATVFSSVVANLNLIFTVIYAYIGFNFSVALISMKGKRTVAWLIIIAALFMMTSLAFQLLAFVGVFCTVVGNKARANGQFIGFDMNNDKDMNDRSDDRSDDESTDKKD